MSHLKFCYRLMHENSGVSDSAVLLMRQNDNRIRLVVSFKAFTSCIQVIYLLFNFLQQVHSVNDSGNVYADNSHVSYLALKHSHRPQESMHESNNILIVLTFITSTNTTTQPLSRKSVCSDINDIALFFFRLFINRPQKCLRHTVLNRYKYL